MFNKLNSDCICTRVEADEPPRHQTDDQDQVGKVRTIQVSDKPPDIRGVPCSLDLRCLHLPTLEVGADEQRRKLHHRRGKHRVCGHSCRSLSLFGGLKGSELNFLGYFVPEDSLILEQVGNNLKDDPG